MTQQSNNNTSSQNSIWDIYANAKNILPLYPRIQNRSTRQESKKIQSDINNTTNTTPKDRNNNSTITKQHSESDLHSQSSLSSLPSSSFLDQSTLQMLNLGTLDEEDILTPFTNPSISISSNSSTTSSSSTTSTRTTTATATTSTTTNNVEANFLSSLKNSVNSSLITPPGVSDSMFAYSNNNNNNNSSGRRNSGFVAGTGGITPISEGCESPSIGFQNQNENVTSKPKRQIKQELSLNISDLLDLSNDKFLNNECDFDYLQKLHDENENGSNSNSNGDLNNADSES
ncbi:unnamed protein product [Ambrosiozyma monospora]|uniref:Unnamed protein product n=1 Tax=Ambrosiozyma monospora TaxID=43982 RepID=A0ACB5TC96_AMBMO|nr:unnamed protein product [Ambrosiozyma monospora]